MYICNYKKLIMIQSLTKDLWFVTTTVVDWIDIFTRPQYKDIIIDSLVYCQQIKGFEIYAWVLMPNHLHMIVSSKGDIPISDILRDFKKYTSRQIKMLLQNDTKESRRKWMLTHFETAADKDAKHKEFKLWQNGFYATLLYSSEMYNQKIRYILDNPVRMGFVDKAENYKYSSAHDLVNGNGKIILSSDRVLL